MWRRLSRFWDADAAQRDDAFILPDGHIYVVPRGNLVAAKDLLAARKAAERRVAAHRPGAADAGGGTMGRA